MSRFVVSFADLWIGRWARPDAEALNAVEGLIPAVVVTGGSRGIGRALAHRFARAGRVVAIVARDEAALAAASRDIAHAEDAEVAEIVLDITAPDAPAALDAALGARGLYTDVLVNNAGTGLAGPFEQQSSAEIEALIELNIAAATRLMAHALPAMLKRGRGGVLNIASLGGMVPGPYQAAYYASKAYVISLTEAVAHESRGKGVRISVVAPGPVETGFHRAMGAEGTPYRAWLPALSPQAVAASAYRGFVIGRTKIVPGILPTLAALALKILPNFVNVPLVGALLAKPSHLPNSREKASDAAR